MSAAANPLAACGAAVPTLLSSMPRALEVQVPAFARLSEQVRAMHEPLAVQLRAMHEPLAGALQRAVASADRVQRKRRRLVSKLGRRAANHSGMLATLEELSLEAFEDVLDAILSGAEPLGPLAQRLARLVWLRAEAPSIEREARHRRAARLERNAPPRRPRVELRERKPRTERSACRPVGSLAPPRCVSSETAHGTRALKASRLFTHHPPRGSPVT